MSEKKDKKPVRDLIGGSIRNNKLALGAAIFLVAAINLFDLVPRLMGVPVSLLLIWLISWLMRGNWSDLGVRRPQSWGKAIAIGMSIGILSQLFAGLVLIPFLQQIGMTPLDYSDFENVPGNIGLLLMYLTVSWTTAGFGEEVVYRGFLMGNLARLLGGKKTGWLVSLLVVSAVFALGHAYQGPMGIALVMYAAILYGTLYIVSDYNLWYTIIAHITADTFVFFMIFLGFADYLL